MVLRADIRHLGLVAMVAKRWMGFPMTMGLTQPNEWRGKASHNCGGGERWLSGWTTRGMEDSPHLG